MIDLLTTCAIGDFFNAKFLLEFFVEHAGYWLVFMFMTIESSFIPFPSEVVVPPAAYLAVQKGDMNIFIIALVATAGALCGALINYFLSLWLGRPIVYAFANSRLGHACLLNEEKVRKAEDYFDRHGAVSTFIGRLIPAIRQLISIPAGISRMNLGTFCIFTALGAGVWNIILTALGYWLGHTVPLSDLYASVEKYNGYLTIGGLCILAFCIIYIIWNAMKAPATKKS